MSETLSIKVPRSVKVKLKSLAAKKKTTPSKLMRRALDRVLKSEEAAVDVSCYELTKDLVEKCGEGPKNLSHHKKHMKGFGA